MHPIDAVPAKPDLVSTLCDLASRVVPALILATVILMLVGCSPGSQEWFKSRADTLAAIAAKVKEAAPAYCKLRPLTNLDDRALAAVALATSEEAANVVKASVDKLCSWVGEPAG